MSGSPLPSREFEPWARLETYLAVTSFSPYVLIHVTRYVWLHISLLRWIAPYVIMHTAQVYAQI